MWIHVFAILIGFLVLTYSADRFVVGAAATAKLMGMSKLLIGLTIVSFGTSAPELLVSAIASWNDAGNLAVGNALGSNIANIALVLGTTALIAPIAVPRVLFRSEFLLLLASCGLCFYAIHDLTLTLSDGLLLLGGLVLALWQFARQGAASKESAEIEHEVEESIPEMSAGKALATLIGGLVLLLISSRLLVWGATELALSLGVSELVIGLTIVAIGTSLPELAASIASALKNHHDIAIGTIIGSNIFNLLGVLGLPGLFGDLAMESSALSRDFSIMFGFTLLLILFAAVPPSRPGISRPEGLILVSGYAAYLLLLYFQLGSA